jgi:hypothetical protein
MFVLNGKPLALDCPFEANGTLYPANWLRLASPAEREAIGITEVPDAPIYDQRFYWGYTASGTLIPKDHGVLVSGWTDQTRTTANTLLAPTDWTVVRELDNGTPMPSGIKQWRQETREACEVKVYIIRDTKTTDELASYVTGPLYPVWPSIDPPAPSGVPEVLDFTDGVTSGAVVTDTTSLAGDSGTDTVIL